MDTIIIRETVKKIVENLVNRNFASIYEQDLKKLIPVEDIQSAIDDYGGVLTMPPDNAFDSMDIYEVSPTYVRVDFDLWDNNKVSDLTLSCNVSEIDGLIKYGIEDIHIL